MIFQAGLSLNTLQHSFLLHMLQRTAVLHNILQEEKVSFFINMNSSTMQMKKSSMTGRSELPRMFPRAYDIHGLDGRLGHWQLQQDGCQGTMAVFEAGP